MIRVLLAEDHETIREGLRLLIDAQPDMRVVSQVGDGRAAVDATATLRPDVVVLDLSMPVLGGLSAARELKKAGATSAIVALTRHEDDAFVHELLDAGAAGYILKQSASAELLRAIRVAAAGGRYIDPALPTDDLSHDPRRRLTSPRATDREVRVLRLIAAGHSNKEIAAALNISVKTVEVHKANAMRKLGLRGRTDVVRYAVINGWLDDA
ncbi:MAG TPA: response regulator transcription factor [Vicinamibacterales bacterium]|nr:response regulator transcription factor [Vicinamibacterales bacterium]